MFESRAPVQARLSRRLFLGGTAAGALLSGAPGAFAEARDDDLERFLELSEKLTARQNLPRETARFYLRGVIETTGPDPLWNRLLTEEARAAIESRIVADWYSGQMTTAEGVVCVDYAGALLWRAIGYAKPAGVPDPDAGRWARAPS